MKLLETARSARDMLDWLDAPFPRRVVSPDVHVRPILFDPHIDAIRVLQIVGQQVVDVSGDASRLTSEICKLRGVVRSPTYPNKVVVAAYTDSRSSQATCIDAHNVLQDKIRCPAF